MLTATKWTSHFYRKVTSELFEGFHKLLECYPKTTVNYFKQVSNVATRTVNMAASSDEYNLQSSKQLGINQK